LECVADQVAASIALVLVLHQIGRADLGSGSVADADAHAQLLVAVDDVVALATEELVTSGTAELDVTLAPERAAERAPSGGREPDDRGQAAGRVRGIDIRLWRMDVAGQRRHQGIEPGDPVETVLVKDVAAREAATARTDE